jgi:hypothetical protein
MEISINTKWSLVFVLMLISTFIGQNKEFFFHACVEEGCSASVCIAHEKKLEILSIENSVVVT